MINTFFGGCNERGPQKNTDNWDIVLHRIGVPMSKLAFTYVWEFSDFQLTCLKCPEMFLKIQMDLFLSDKLPQRQSDLHGTWKLMVINSLVTLEF